METPRPIAANMIGFDVKDFDDALSDSSTPRSTVSDVGRAQHTLDPRGNTMSRGGDRVMSRRSGQQATNVDLFGRPPSSFHPVTGRLNSAAANSGSASALFDSLGPGSQDLTQDVLHHSIHGGFHPDISLAGKQRSVLIDGAVHNLFSPSDLDHDQMSDEIRGLFEYIHAYKVQEVEIGTILKPFIPDYILSVGAIDEFIKVPRPDKLPDHLGLKVLDESGPKQSDPAVLTLQLRAASNQPNLHLLEVSSLENADKNPKKLDAWIHSIKDLHRTKPMPCVTYSKAMPDVEKLVQEWPSEIQKALADIQLPTAKLEVDLATFVDICCSILDIPVYKSRVESLHVMFSLYLELRNSAAPHFSCGGSDWVSGRRVKQTCHSP